MTEEQIKQRANDFIITRQNHIKYFSGEAVKILLKNFAEEIVAEATKELQEENEQLKNDYEMIHNCFLISENEKKKLQEDLEQAKKVKVVEHFEAFGQCRDSRQIASLEARIEKLKCCQNCKHCNEVKSYKGLGGKEITKVCSDGNYVCDDWEFGR